jgi:hypothetical protein
VGETAVVVVTADTTAYERSMGGTVAPAQAAANKVSTAFSSEFNKISSGAAALASGIGGPLGKVGSIANSALKPLTEVASSIGGIGGSLALVGGAAGLAVGALGAIALSAKGLADSAVEADERLSDLGIVTENRGALIAYADATDDLSIAMDELRVAVGGDIAQSLTTVVQAAAGGIRTFLDLRDSWAETTEQVQAYTRELVALSSLGLSEWLIGQTEDLADANDRLSISYRGLTTEMIFGLSKSEEAALRAQAERTARDAAAQAARDQADAERALAEAQRAAEAQHQLVMDARIDAYRAAADAANAAADEEIAAILRTRQAQAAANEEIDAEVAQILADRVSAVDTAADAAILAAAREASAYLSAASQITGALTSITNLAVQGYLDRAAAGETLHRVEVEQANAAMAAAEAAAIVAAGIQATLSGLGAITALIPFMGPAAIPVGATIAAALFAAAVAGIEAGQPARFSNPYNGSGRGDGASAGELAGIGPNDDNPSTDKPTSGDDLKDLADDYRNGTSRRGRGDVTISLDPRLNRLQVVSDRRVGKRRIK